ncbi:MAG: glycosyltransferase family 2 protein [Oscillospiraceae bacterium]|nr:glycosyltransferase family 2 protein [Oscillospiraceae bacterium]
MLFSVVVPVYNVADYLPKCMNSLLGQDFDDFEIILVDDGATDGKCPALCDQYAAKCPERVRTIHQANGGLGAARNTGLEAAKGEYLFFVDSDDYIAPEALSSLAREIHKTRADMYVFGFWYVEGEEIRPGEPPKAPLGQPLTLRACPELLLEPPMAWARIYRKELFFDTGIRYPARVWYEDLHTTPKCLYQARQIVVLPQMLYFYLLREGSIMRSSNIRRNLEILDALEAVRCYFADVGKLSQYYDALSCLAVEHTMLAAQRVLMADPKADILPDFLGYVQKHFPDYRKNPMLSRLGRKKRIALRLLEWKQYRLLYSLFTMQRRRREKNGRS